MADVFISYKSERRAGAEHLAEILADYGYTVWWDYGLVTGRDFGAQIEKELRAAKAVIVLWCSLSINSEWVREEATLAKRLNKLIPTLIEQVDLPLGFTLAHTLDLSEWDGAPQSNRLDRLLREIGQFVGRAPKPNPEGLERTERAWRRFGAPALRDFALIDALERKLPPRTLPATLGSTDDGERRGKSGAALYAGLGAAALIAVGIAAAAFFSRNSVATSAADVPSIEGRWVGEGQDCRYAMRLVREGDSLTIAAPGFPPSKETIAAESAGRVETASGIYARRGEQLVLRTPDGSEQAFDPCA